MAVLFTTDLIIFSKKTSNGQNVLKQNQHKKKTEINWTTSKKVIEEIQENVHSKKASAYGLVHLDFTLITCN